MKRILMNVRLYGVVALLLILVSCENPILFQIEKDVFRATSEKFAEVVLRNGLTVVDIGGEVRFGDTAIGGTPQVEGFSIENGGDFQLELKSISFTGTNADSFVLEEPSIAVLEPGDQTSFSITFDPVGDPGIQSASMVVEYEGGEQDSVEFTLSGEAYGGFLEEIQLFYNDESGAETVLVPIDYNNDTITATTAVPVGSSDTFTFTVKNLGQNDLELTSGGAVEFTESYSPSDPGLFQVDNAATTATVNTETTFSVDANFSSIISRGTHSVTIDLPNSDDNEGDLRFTLAVVAQAPDIAVGVDGTDRADGATVSLEHWWQRDGVLSIPFVVRNVPWKTQPLGDADLVLNANVTASGTDFSVVGAPASGATLAPNETATFALELDVATNGTYTTTVTLDKNDLDENPFEITVEVSAGPPDLAVTYTHRGGVGDPTPELVSDGDTIYIGEPKSSEEGVVDLFFENQGYHSLAVSGEKDWRGSLTGLPAEDGSPSAFNIDTFKLDETVGAGDTARVTLVWDEKLNPDLFYRERVTLFTDDPDTPEMTFFVAAGNAIVYAAGYSDPSGGGKPDGFFPTVWAIDLTGPAVSDAMYVDVPGELFGGFVTSTEGRGTLRFYGAMDLRRRGVLEAAYVDFYVDSRSFGDPKPLERILELGEGLTTLVHGASFDSQDVFLSGEISDYGYQPGDEWWIERPKTGFIAQGPAAEAAERLGENETAYTAVARGRELGGGAWTAGASVADKTDPSAWRDLRTTDPLVFDEAPNHGAVLGADGATYYTGFVGHQDSEASFWVYDEPEKQIVGYPLGKAGFAFGLTEAGRENHLVVGTVEGKPVYWNDMGATIDGFDMDTGTSGQALDALYHVYANTAQATVVSAGRLVVSDKGFGAVWSAVKAPPVLTTEMGRINTLVDLIPMSIYAK